MDDVDRFRLRSADMSHPAMQVAMPLVSVHDGEARCIGSSFLIAPGVALTAAHVARDWLEHQETRDGYKRPDASFSALALQFFQSRLLAWHVRDFHGLDTADIAVLFFHRPTWWGDGEQQLRPPFARLNMNPPAVGEEVRVFGFPNSSIEEGIVTVSPAECTARVREVSLKNKSPFRPTSYVELDGEMLGGMSGGPCFDKAWNVVGMVSKGIDFGEAPAESPISYMALLWPAMSLPHDLFGTGPRPIWDLLKDGSLQPIGRRRIEVGSEGRVQFATVDPDSLRRLPPERIAAFLEGPLDFAMTNARGAIIQVREILTQDFSPQSGQSNQLYLAIREFFWELDSALRIAIATAAARLGLELESPVDWQELEHAWRNTEPTPDVQDALVSLRFEWDGLDLFEVRAYADRAKEGGLLVQSIIDPSGQRVHTQLSQCRRGGAKVTLPDDLERFVEACGHFIRRLLGLTALIGAL